MQQVGRAHKAGAQLLPVGADQVGQSVGGLLRIFRQAEMHRQHMLRLGTAVGIVFSEAFDKDLVQVPIGVHIFAQQISCLAEQLDRVEAEGGGDEAVPGGALVAAAGGVQPQPVAKVEVFFPAVAGNVVHPLFHALELLVQNAPIAVGLIDRPGADDRRVPPGGAAGIRGQQIGDHFTHFAALALVGGQIPQPFAEETLHIVEIRCGADEDLGVACPAQALIPLWAVGGHVQEIPALAPDDVGKELIEHRIAGFQPPDALHVRVDDDGGEALGPNLAGP